MHASAARAPAAPSAARDSLEEDIAKMQRLIFGDASPEVATASAEGPQHTRVPPLTDGVKRSRRSAGEMHSPDLVERKRGKVSPAREDTTLGQIGNHASLISSSASQTRSVDLSLEPPLSLSTLIRERERAVTRAQVAAAAALTPSSPQRQGHVLQRPQPQTPTPPPSHPLLSSRRLVATPHGAMAFAFMDPEDAYAQLVARHRRWAEAHPTWHSSHTTSHEAPRTESALTGNPSRRSADAYHNHGAQEESLDVVNSPHRSPIHPQHWESTLEEEHITEPHAYVVPTTSRWTLHGSRPPLSAAATTEASRFASLTRRLREALGEVGEDVPIMTETTQHKAKEVHHVGRRVDAGKAGSSPAPRAPAALFPGVTPALQRTPSPSPPPPPSPPSSPPHEHHYHHPDEQTAPIRVLSVSQGREASHHPMGNGALGDFTSHGARTASVGALKVYSRRREEGLVTTPPLPLP